MLLLASCKERITNELPLPTKEQNLPSLALHHLRKYSHILTQQKSKKGVEYFLNAMIRCATAVCLDVQVCVGAEK